MAKSWRLDWGLQGSRRKVSGGTPAVPHPTAADIELDRLSEVELWQRVVRLMEAAKQKQGMLSGQDTTTILVPDAEVRVSTSQQTNVDTSMWAFATTALPVMQVLDMIGAHMWGVSCGVLHGIPQKDV